MFGVDGAAVSAEFAVNTKDYSTQYQPAAAALPGGGLVLARASYNDETYTHNIRAQRYEASGTAAGGEFTLNTTTSGTQNEPQLSATATGFVAV